MATLPQEDSIPSDNPIDDVANEVDRFSEFINDIFNDDTLVPEPNMEFSGVLNDESAFDPIQADFLEATGLPINSGNFPDFENQIMITSDTDRFILEPTSASANIDISEGKLLGASNSNDFAGPSSTEPASATAVESSGDDLLVSSSSNGFAEAQKRRREKGRRSATKPPLANAEIIDLDSLQPKSTYIKTEGGEDVTFIKAEPGVNYPAAGFIRWPNTKDEAIEISDDDEPPPAGPSLTPKVQQPAKKNDKKSPSTRLEDVPMRVMPSQDVGAQLTEPETTQPMLTRDDPEECAAPTMLMEIEPVEDVPSPLATTSEARIGDEMEADTATRSNNGNSLKEGRATDSNTSISTPNLGSTTFAPKNAPSKQGGPLNATLRGKLKDAGKLFRKNHRKQPAPIGGNFSVPGPPSGPSSSISALPVALATSETPSVAAGPSAPLLQAITPANSSAPRAPAPELAASLAGRSSAPGQHLDNDPSAEDILADLTEMDTEMLDHFADNTYPDDYLDAVQKLKENRLAYQARGEKDEVAEIELMQAEAELDQRRKQLEEDKQYDMAPEEDSLFVQSDSRASDFEALANYDSGSGPVFESEVQAKPRGRSGGSSGKKGRGGMNKPVRPPKSKTNNDKVKDKNAKVSKKSAKSKKNGGGSANVNPNMLDIGSLFTSDIFRAAHANQGQRQLPVMDSTRRDLALKQLVASVPLEHRKMAQVDKTYLDSACRDFVGKLSVRAVPGNDGWQVSGMTCVLKHHQLLGSAFMRRRERSNENPHGGICADQMGLGKTIMMLANIVNGRPSPTEHGPKTTLIVAPPALITQWMAEINRHTLQETKNKWVPLKVLKWHGNSKPVTNDRLGGIPDYDIVLTTYDEVRKSYPKEDYPIHLQTRQEREAWWQLYYEKQKSTLHRVEFLRIVLDEAQAIKNYKSHTSIACRGLTAKHRWALSGTPIQNAPKELFPYFKFLQVEHTGTFKIFCQNFIGSHSDGSLSRVGLDRLHSFLSRFMIRRTHADQLMGAPIVSLPKASERIYWCRFNDLERAVYEMVRARMIQRINRLSRTKQLENSYSNVLTMLLRLRQLTGHILAIEQPMKDLLEKEDHEKIYDLAMEARDRPESGNDEKMRALRAELYRPGDERNKDKHSAGMPGVRNEENEQVDEKDRADSVHDSPSRKDCSDIGRHHGKRYDFLRYLEDLKDGICGRNADKRSACSYCNDVAEEPYKTQCYHVYCKKCLERMGEDAAMQGMGRARCVVCHTVYTSTSPCDEMNFDQDKDGLDDDSMDGYSDQELLRPKPKKNKKKRPMFVEKAKDWIDLADGNDILPSAKTLAIKAQIINWLQEDPQMKIIIYTQFMAMIRILSKVCSAEKWKFSTYHGGKSHEARDLAIQEFSENPDMRIMLASTRCGGVGLNLTMAQKVVIVDPWWNSSVEQQAFCRVFRIGQEQATSMTRFVVEKTVDENIIRMQERKQMEIDSVMDNDQHRKLTIPELLRLFGDVDADENGNPFILVNNRATLPNPNGDMEDEGYDDD
ncbi:putative serine/threonine-protein phosphatase [Venturia nashicola]|nr:putative serine/threonine-protein phosphatase [Venturia nashicola]